VTGIEWVPIIPSKGRIKETAAELLALVDDPTQVRTARGGTEFRVPQSVADAYTAKPFETKTTPPPRQRRSRTKKSED
jgi:hypothetical protein